MILSRIGLITYGLLSILEGIINTIIYTLFLDKVVGVVDISLPFYFWWTNRFLKGRFLKAQRQKLKDNYGQDI